ncbi:MAG: hypothetical protein PHQ40_13905 [Anaerolineaceae bacterium]|nr:hypothetical protein [Anaerolineaceae bacterium]
MATTEERLKILTMIQDGKITAEDGARLLEVLESRRTGPTMGARPEGTPPSSVKGPRYMRVRVTDTATGKPRVNVRLPVSLVNAGLKMGARFSPEVQGLNMDELNRFINSGEIGQIVDVYDDEDGEHVEVFLE